MELQLVDSSTILLSGKSGKVILNPLTSLSDLSKWDASFVIGGEKVSDGVFQVSSPGEYERSDMLVSAYQTEVGIDKKDADIFEVDVENVNSCFVGSEVKTIPDSILDEMGVVNVLFVFVEDVEAAKKIVQLIDPHIVIPLGTDEEGVKKFIASLGLGDFEREKKLKLKEEDFVGEEIPMRLVHLSK